MAEGEDAAQQIINGFISTMVVGKRLPMLRSDGVSSECLLQMDQDVTALTYTVGGQRRDVTLDDISQITIGEEIPEEVELAVDDSCVTLVLWDGEAVAFQFEDIEGRDTFALCLGMFVDQHRQAAEGEEEYEEYEDDVGAPAGIPVAAAAAHAPAASSGAGSHAYNAQDFWKPTWCDDCKTLLTGWSKQGQVCLECRQVVCHPCAAKGGRCPSAAGAGAAGHSPAGSSGTKPNSGGGATSSPKSGVAAGATKAAGARPSGAGAGGRDDGLNDGQKIVKKFVQRMVRGRELNMLSKAGGAVECLVHLDRELKNIYIQRAGKKDAKKRGVPLGSVQEICVGVDVVEEVELPVDEMSVTLMLEEGQAIAFRLDNQEDRDTFALCMGMFVDGNRKEAERKTKKR